MAAILKYKYKYTNKDTLSCGVNMSKSSERVKKWRESTKKRLVEGFGGKCAICKYSKCMDALEFHHINPSEKEFSLGGARGSILSWAKILNEAKKCILLCANCHREFHAGLVNIPSEIPKFDSEYAPPSRLKNKNNKILIKEKTYCPICNSEKNNKLSTCSVSCSKIRIRKVERPTYEDLILELKKGNYCSVARKYGVSDNAVRKWIKFYEKNLESTNKMRE